MNLVSNSSFCSDLELEFDLDVDNNLYRHFQSKHLEKNIKCEECNFVTDRKDSLKIHIQAKHTLKKCNECQYTSLSFHDMKKHKDNQHEPDIFLSINSCIRKHGKLEEFMIHYLLYKHINQK